MKSIRSVEEFNDVLSCEQNFLAYFGTETCSVCHVTKPKVDDLMKLFPRVPAFYCAADQLPELAGQYLIFAVPAVLVFHKKREIFRSARFIDLLKVEEAVMELSGNNDNVLV